MNLTSILPGVLPNLLLLLLIDSCLIFQSMLCKRLHAKNSGSSSSGGGNSSSSSGKKKVVIIGEMSDLAFEMATNASASTNYALDDVTFADYDPQQPNPYQNEDHESHHHDHHRHHPVSKYGLSDSRGKIHRIRPWVGKRTTSGLSPSAGSVFVPVAAYSVTHSRVGAGPGGVRRMRPVRKAYSLIPAGSSPSGKTTESAVYGYVQKPEIVEFRGQYFYGPNPSPGVGSHYHPSHYSPIPLSSSHHHYSPGLTASASDSVASSSASSWIPWSSGSSSKISHKSGGLGPGGLLLATLPLILAPMLSYLFTPMVIPVTATIAAGRRRRRSIRDSDRRLLRHEDDDAFSTTGNSSVMLPVLKFIPHHLTPASPESGSMTNFLPRTSQTATPFGFDSIKTMNLSGARKRNAGDEGEAAAAAVVAGATSRQSPMSPPRAIVPAIVEVAELNFSKRDVSKRQITRYYRNRMLHKRQSPG